MPVIYNPNGTSIGPAPRVQAPPYRPNIVLPPSEFTPRQKEIRLYKRIILNSWASLPLVVQRYISMQVAQTPDLSVSFYIEMCCGIPFRCPIDMVETACSDEELNTLRLAAYEIMDEDPEVSEDEGEVFGAG